jgi:Tol biopolymer transport system component
MLTGRQPFQGEDVSLVLSTVLQMEPDWTAVPGASPGHIVALMKRCLRKDPKARLRDIGEARIALAEGDEGQTETLRMPAGRQRRVAAMTWIVSGVLGLAVLVLMARASGSSGPSTSGPLARFEVELPTALPTGFAVALSPDGHHFVFVGGDDNNTGRQVLFRRALDDLAIQEVTGSTGANYPFFSPDGRWIGFHAEGELRRVPLDGGLPITIAQTPEAWGASWSARGDIVFGTPGSGLYRVAAAGGTPTPLTRPADEAEAHVWPRILPDGETVLFTIWKTDGRNPSIGVTSLDGGDVRAIVDGTSPQYSPTGHLLFVRQQTLLGVPFDISEGVPIGEPTELVDGVISVAGGFAGYELSQTGHLVYLRTETPLNRARLVFVDRNGRTEAVLDAQQPGYLQPAFSPDGRRLAFGYDDQGPTVQLSTYDLTERRRRPLVFESAFTSVWPVWSPDGQWVAFTSDRSGAWNVFRADAGGSGKVEQLTADPKGRQAPTSWSVDSVLAIEQGPIGAKDILTLSLGDNPKLEPLLVNEFNERGGKFSPNGRWLAFTSNRSGQDEIWVKAFPGDAPPVPVSIGGGKEPVWSRDGRELFYRNGRRLMRVPVETEPSFRAGQPSLLFEGNYTYGYLDWSFNYDVAPDGSRFVMVEEGPATKAAFLLNWTEELKRIVPAN